ncbi:MAG: DUF721 domain-containing protein [Prevotellaceae bacterium]|jgi:hypothetical protein|nr:DUF721 domain-containing protein [Prevotellaceae bacterium]
MERINPEKIEKALKLYIKKLGLEDGFKKYRMIKIFNEIVGDTVLEHVTKKDIQGRKLFIYLNSAVARNELSMKRSTIIKSINEKYGEYIIEEIILN